MKTSTRLRSFLGAIGKPAFEQISVLGGFPDGSDGKEPTCSAGDSVLIPGSGRSPGERNGNPLQYSCLENPVDRRALAGYSAWGHKKSDMTEVSGLAYREFFLFLCLRLF